MRTPLIRLLCIAEMLDRSAAYREADLLTEEIYKLAGAITLAEALATITSKASIRACKGLDTTINKENNERKTAVILQYLRYCARVVEEEIATFDISEQYQGMTAIWVKNHIIIPDVLEIDVSNTKDRIEDTVAILNEFYSVYDFIPDGTQRDLSQINTTNEVLDVISIAQKNKAEAAAKKFRGPDFNRKAIEGTEFVGESNNWMVYAPHNIEAACKLGNGTNWCTSARSETNQFDKYYKPSDHLYILINKENPSIKFQFHYGERQFMDAEDNATSPENYEFLHDILMKVLGEERINSQNIGVVDAVNKLKDATSEEGEQSISRLLDMKELPPNREGFTLKNYIDDAIEHTGQNVSAWSDGLWHKAIANWSKYGLSHMYIISNLLQYGNWTRLADISRVDLFIVGVALQSSIGAHYFYWEAIEDQPEAIAWAKSILPTLQTLKGDHIKEILQNLLTAEHF